MPATIWVVDDEPQVRDVLGAMLRELGYETEVFEDAETALDAMGGRRPDVVITDVRMPGMSGMDLVNGILERDPEAIVMILTGYPSIPDAVEAIRRGASDFLSKPIRMEELRLRLERALESREIEGRLKRTRAAAWILIATLPLWFILGVLLARLLQQ